MMLLALFQKQNDFTYLQSTKTVYCISDISHFTVIALVFQSDQNYKGWFNSHQNASYVSHILAVFVTTQFSSVKFYFVSIAQYHNSCLKGLYIVR